MSETSQATVLKTLHDQIDAMLLHLCASGQPVPAFSFEHRDSTDIVTLGAVHQQLARLVEPARPETLLLFKGYEESRKKPLFGIRMAVPIARGFIVLSLGSLLGVLLIGACHIVTAAGPLNPNVEAKGLGEGILWGYGLVQYAYLCLAASLGATFHVLFNLNRYILDRNYDPSHNLAHVIRYVLGLVAGVMLAVMLWPVIKPAGTTPSLTENLSVAALAMVGGFSAKLVHRILQGLVSAISSIMEGDASTVEERATRAARTEASARALEERIDDLGLLQKALDSSDLEASKRIIAQLIAQKSTGTVRGLVSALPDDAGGDAKQQAQPGAPARTGVVLSSITVPRAADGSAAEADDKPEAARPQ